MDHQYIQIPPEGDQRPSLSFQDGEILLNGVEEARPARQNFLIPRKPVGSNQPRASNILVESNQTAERSQRSTSKVRSTEICAHRGQVYKNWWMEIGTCCLFLMALVAITVTLHPHQGKPLPQWPYRLSVNTLISIYVVVLKGTVLLVAAAGLGQLKWRWLQNSRPLQDLVIHDEATHGPLGALTLLWRLRFRHPLSSVGALITLVTLAVDPFTQQIIHYYDCSIAMNGLQAAISRTNVYRWTNPDLEAVISDAIVSPHGLVNPICVTGNCTFKEYGSVGYCSSCIDITQDLIIRSTIVKSNYTDNYVGNTLNPNGTETPESITYPGFMENTNVSVSTSLPSGLSVSTYPGTKFNITATGIFNLSVSEKEYRVEMIVGKQFKLLDPATGQPPTRCDTVEAKNTWRCRGYGAASCSLSPCVRTYTSTIEAGKLHETRVSISNSTWGATIPPPTDPSNPFGMYVPYLGMADTMCLSAHKRQSLLKAGYHLDPSTRWLAYKLTFDPESGNISTNASFPESMLVNECIYILGNAFVYNLWNDFMIKFFESTLEGDAGHSGAIEDLKGSQNLQTIYNYGDVSFDRVNSTFQNISDSITNYFRQNGLSKYSDPAKGVVLQDQTCLSVQWAWLAFPSALVLLTLIFFVITVIDTRPTGNRAPMWKSSPLAFYFHGLELPNRLQSSVDDINGMENLAKDIIVRLDTVDKELNFVSLEDQQEDSKGGVENRLRM